MLSEKNAQPESWGLYFIWQTFWGLEAWEAVSQVVLRDCSEEVKEKPGCIGILQQKPGSRTAGSIFQSQQPVLVYQNKGKHSVWAFENQRQGLASSCGDALVTWPVWRRADRDSLLHCPSLWLCGHRPAYLTGIVCCHEKNTFTEVFGSVSFFWPKYVYVFIYIERGRLAKPWKESVAYQKNTSFNAFFSH